MYARCDIAIRSPDVLVPCRYVLGGSGGPAKRSCAMQNLWNSRSIANWSNCGTSSALWILGADAGDELTFRLITSECVS